ncbi:MAG: vWA domain-containing protein [Clostridia bacterium]|nr:vWA domain-containing protein [Clostridia bacterium]
MKKGLTDLVFILDRSGSMSGLESDTIGGFNSMIQKQRKVEGECRITTVLFDDKIEFLHDRVDLNKVKKLTEREYYVRGCTALLDAIGLTLSRMGSAQKYAIPEARAEKVMVVIITDGMENSSREYSLSEVRNMIERQRDKYGWEIIFLGANIDAVRTARDFGIRSDRAQDFHADRRGIRVSLETVAEASLAYRAYPSMELPNNWNEKLKRDYEEREK